MTICFQNNAKNKNVVRVLRFVVFLFCIFKGFYTADGYYNGGELMGMRFSGLAFYAAMIIVVGAVMFLLSLMLSSISFSSLTRSKWSPINSTGVSCINYCTFHIVFAISLITCFLIQGVLGLVMYYYPITLAFVSMVIFKVVALLAVCLNMLLLSRAVPKGQFKQLFVAMLFPNILAILLLG